MSQMAKLAGTAALLIGQIALELSGYQNTWLSGFLVFAAAVLFAFWVIDGIKNFLARRKSVRSTAWAKRDRIELYDLACRMAHKPQMAPFKDEPQRSYHKRLKDAVDDGNLVVLDMRGPKPNEKTLVTRDALRAYAKKERWPELTELLLVWDQHNPPKLDSGLPELPKAEAPG
jgi:hypothetical protein